MNPTAVRAIQAMVAPAVLITTAAILSGALLSIYGAVNDRMRAMARERLDLLTGEHEELQVVASLSARRRERLTQIDVQLPMLLHRHRLLHHAILVTFLSIGIMVLSVIGIGAAVTANSDGAATAALVLMLAGTVTLLAGLALAAWSIEISRGSIDYEVRRSLSLGA